MVTSADFLEAFPEFAPADAGLVEKKIAEAGRRIAADVWGEKADDGISYLAAHLLAISPFGQHARLVARDGSTTYQDTFEALKREVASGPQLI